MANLMDIFLNFFNNSKFRPLCEKQISCGIEYNSTVGRIELIQTQFEMSTPSLPSEHTNKKMLAKKFFTEKDGGVPLNGSPKG